MITSMLLEEQQTPLNAMMKLQTSLPPSCKCHVCYPGPMLLRVNTVSLALGVFVVNTCWDSTLRWTWSPQPTCSWSRCTSRHMLLESHYYRLESKWKLTQIRLVSWTAAQWRLMTINSVHRADAIASCRCDGMVQVQWHVQKMWCSCTCMCFF